MDKEKLKVEIKDIVQKLFNEGDIGYWAGQEIVDKIRDLIDRVDEPALTQVVPRQGHVAALEAALKELKDNPVKNKMTILVLNGLKYQLECKLNEDLNDSSTWYEEARLESIRELADEFGYELVEKEGN